MEYPLMDKILRAHAEMGNDLTIVSMKWIILRDMGESFRDEYGEVLGIVEENDCNETKVD